MINNVVTDSLITRVIKGKNQGGKIPIWMMRQAGRHLPEYKEKTKNYDDFFKICYNPELITELTLQPVLRYNFDAAIIFSDILVLPKALGCKVELIRNIGPSVEPITNHDQIKNDHSFLRNLTPIFEAIKNTRNVLSSEKDLIGFAGSPWTVATYLIEGKNSINFLKTKEICYKNSAEFTKIINKITEATAIYLIKQIESGVDIIQLFDSHTSCLSAEQFRRWVIEPTKHIVSIIKQKYPYIPIIGFPKGAGVLYREYSKTTGISCLSLDYSVPLDWIKSNIKVPVQGNLDPFLLAYDRKKSLLQTKKILETLKNHNLIFNLGHGIIPETPVENVYEIVKLVKNYKYEN